MLKPMTVLLLALASLDAWAAATQSTINKIQLYETDMLVSVWLAGGNTTPAACDSVAGAYLSFSMTRPLAQQYLDALLAAQARQATVKVWTANDCVDQTGVETLLYFQVLN